MYLGMGLLVVAMPTSAALRQHTRYCTASATEHRANSPPSIKPISPPMIPPIGTSSCDQRQTRLWLRRLGRSKRLVAEGRRGRNLNNDEAAANPLVTGIAGGGQRVVALDEAHTVLGLDSRRGR